MSTKSELIAGLGIITVGGVLLLGLAKVPVGAKAAKAVKTMPLSYIEVEQTKQLIDAASKFYLDANTAVTATARNVMIRTLPYAMAIGAFVVLIHHLVMVML